MPKIHNHNAEKVSQHKPFGEPNKPPLSNKIKPKFSNKDLAIMFTGIGQPKWLGQHYLRVIRNQKERFLNENPHDLESTYTIQTLDKISKNE